MSLFLESIRIQQGMPQNLYWHQQRVNETFSAFFKSQKPFDLSASLADIPRVQGLFKCRLIYNAQGVVDIQTTAYIPQPLHRAIAINADHLDYAYKKVDRGDIEDLRDSQPDFDDVLFIQNGLITDFSYANAAFLKNGQWFTPRIPLLNGVERRRLVADSVLILADISPHKLHEYSHFKRINAMLSWDMASVYSIDIINGISV